MAKRIDAPPSTLSIEREGKVTTWTLYKRPVTGTRSDLDPALLGRLDDLGRRFAFDRRRSRRFGWSRRLGRGCRIGGRGLLRRCRLDRRGLQIETQRSRAKHLRWRERLCNSARTVLVAPSQRNPFLPSTKCVSACESSDLLIAG